MTDPEILAGLFGTMLGTADAQAIAPRSGGLTALPEPQTTAAATLAAFRQHGGVGWLQTAETAAVWEFRPGAADLAALPDGLWPEAGELFNPARNSSLHLRRAAGGWVLTTLTPAAPPPSGGLLLTERLLHRDLPLKLNLLYEVAWAPRCIGDHAELRPVACRFRGFEDLPPPPAPA